MKALLARPEERKQLSANSRPFSVLAVYENVAARRCAMRLYARIVADLSEKFQFECLWQSFSGLPDGPAPDESGRAAAAADMILIACATDQQPAASLRKWIQSWAGRRTLPDGALVVLIGEAGGEPGPDSAAHDYFASVARRAGMTYYPGHFTLPGEDNGFSMEAIRARAGAHTPTLERTLCSEVPGDHWGINE